jgi:hypothetical protein
LVDQIQCVFGLLLGRNPNVNYGLISLVLIHLGLSIRSPVLIVLETAGCTGLGIQFTHPLGLSEDASQDLRKRLL